MPIGNDSYVNNTLEVLRAFLVSSYPIEKRKNIISGYGLKKEDLDKTPKESFNKNGSKKHKATSKMFSKRKDDLLYDYHIVQLPSNGRGKFFGITPIGISYFCEHMENIDSDIFESIFTHLKFFYEKGKPKEEKSYLDELESIMRNKDLREIPDFDIGFEFKETFANFKIKHSVEDYSTVKMTYTPTSGMEILLSELLYPNGDVGIEDELFTIMSNSNEGTLMISDKDVNGHTFNYYLSKFLIKSFLHSLYCYNKLIVSTLEETGESFYEKKPNILTEYIKSELKLKKQKAILNAFDMNNIEVVKEFQDEINEAVKLYTTAFESEVKTLMMSN